MTFQELTLVVSEDCVRTDYLGIIIKHVVKCKKFNAVPVVKIDKYNEFAAVIEKRIKRDVETIQDLAHTKLGVIIQIK